MERTVVDLRSDTVTRPTPAMRRAMAEAPVGDDVYGEDPTVNGLEETAADLLGFEAALFVPSGTMGNQAALAVHARPGEEVVCEADSHILHYEMAAMAALSGLLPRPLFTGDGLPTAEQVQAAIAPDLPYLARTGVVALENTHNRAGGRVMPLQRQREIQSAAKERGVPVHLDGARIFNAAAALGVGVRDVAAGFDTVMFCLSKGLGAPVGSVLCGSARFIAEARRVRKRFGGGMRQAGVLAAAGLVALETMTERLVRDHETAARLAGELAEVPGLAVPRAPETNILMLEVDGRWAIDGSAPAAGLVRRLAGAGVLALALDARRVRMVTHFDLPPDAVERTLEALAGR